MTKYAYIDQGDILHIADKKETAMTYAKEGTHVVETTLENRMVQPYFNGKTIHVYSPTDMRISAEGYGAEGKKIDPIPELAELYAKCAE